MIKKRRSVLKTIAVFVAVNIFMQTLAPGISYALTNGPSSPEFSSFEPVATTDMVNLFTGDFTYNLPVLDIPGPDGAGYSLSLSYHSGTSSEEEASWVGYGWTLNPGSVTRNTRGFPDDYSKAPVKYYNKSRPNWSVGARRDNNLELFSKDIGLGYSPSLRFNNYQGYQRSNTFGLNIMGMLNLSMNYSAEGITYGAQVNPAGILNAIRESKDKKKEKSQDNSKEKKEWTKEEIKMARQQFRQQQRKAMLKSHVQGAVSSGIGSAYGIFSFNESSRATGMVKYTGSSVNYSRSIQINPPAPVGFQVGTSGNFNVQFNEEQTDKTATGYMNNIVEAQANEMTDYYVEKGSSYSKRDYFLGIPFNNADNFSVSGEGLGGGFRFYPLETGHFYPDKMESKTSTFQAGIELMVGANVGVGVDIGIGTQKLKMENWQKPGNTATWQYNNLGGVLRFNNDLGGEIEYSGNNNAEGASVTQLGNFPGFKQADVNLAALPAAGAEATSIFKTINYNAHRTLTENSAGITKMRQSVGRSSFIDYRTNAQLAASPSTAFNKTANISDITYRTAPPPEMASGISEVSVHNEEGNQYVYGLPTYTRNEVSLQFDIKDASVYDNYIAYQPVHYDDASMTVPNLSGRSTVVGEVRKVPYATNYLLTQILTSDYVDIGTPGVSDDDFGGWTQLNYHKTYGGSNEWYRYRTPYSGLLYQRNNISDTKDDVGAVTSGEKEVYYLKTIETKTHIAFFVTNKSSVDRFPSGYNEAYLNGSGTDRLDGRGASKALDGNAERASLQRGSAARGDEGLEYLEKIVLFSKARKDKPVKITRFAYNYSLVGNLPNNVNGNFPNSKLSNESGKLTLEKVWFEYEGVVNSKISPYVFKYEYKDADEFRSNGQEQLLAQHPAFAELLSQYTKESQNPDYTPHLLDAWGNIQNFGKEQQLKDRPWIYQGADNTSGAKSFDPAAWQLKQIKLPSGGEILVEYEQKNYRFVQNRPAMAMASLVTVNDTYENPYYIVNTSDLNITTIEQRNELIARTLKYYGDEKEKIFFKFLYALKGSTARLDYCKSEYIDGYAKVLSVVPESPSSLNIKITLEGKTVSGTSGQRYNSPRQACYDLVANQRLGKVDDMSGNCSTAMEEQFDGPVQEFAQGSMSTKDLRLKLAPTAVNTVFQELSGTRYQIPEKTSVCKVISPTLSYLKLPMVKAKKGGGIRVKRLYMLDNGLESGDAALYGSEYLYENEGGESSGVATNEPTSIRPENPLVTFLPKKNQSWFSKITAGEDKSQTEGPIGESLLPSAAIGHSRVVVKNIHEGPTGAGFAVHEYFTAYDYPFDKVYTNALADTEVTGKAVDYTSLDDNRVTDHVSIPAVFFNYSVDKVWASQGFRFIINNMHGQVRKMATYGGDYKDFSTDKTYLSTMQEYAYFEPGEKLKVLKADGTYTLETPGKEMDIAMEMRSLHDNAMDFNLEMDISVNLTPPWPFFFGVWPTFSLSDSRISTHTTSKVLRYPAIVKSTLAYKDGAYNYTENVAFNGSTGNPILVKTADGFDKVKIGNNIHDGTMYSLTIPASWKYPAMGAKSVSATNTNQLNASAGSFVTYGAQGNLINSANNTWKTNLTAANNVISANVQTFSNSALVPAWFGADVQANYPGLSVTANRTKLNAIWRPYETYAYNAKATSSNQPGEDKIYSGGFFKEFSMPDWTANATQSDANWIKLNQVTRYSPNGNTLEEKNVLGIFSAAKYDYSFGNSRNLLPVMMTSNGEYRSIAFNSYETSGTALVAHSGSRSLVYSSPSTSLLSGLSVTSQLNSKGGIVKLWLKSTSPSGAISPEVLIGGRRIRMDKVAQTGEWSLFSANIDKAAFPTLNVAFSVALAYALRPDEQVFIDDVRFQPLDAQSKCYVYDVSTFKLLTQFDDQHFGLYYQYNSEGKLVRKQVETEKGLKTVQETQYNIPKTSRPVQ